MLWVAAITFTDRFLTTQFLFWFNPALVFAAIVLLLIGWGLRRIGGSRGTGRLAPFLVTLAVIALAGREFGLFRWVAHLTDAGPPRGQAIRVVHWNMSVYDAAPGVDIGERLAGAGTPDIILLNMQNNPRIWQQIEAAMKRGPDTPVTLANLGGYKVFSRFSVTATTTYLIPFTGDNVPVVPSVPLYLRRAFSALSNFMQLHKRSTVALEPALIIGLTFDTTAEYGRPTHAWFIDMPSNPLASRADLVRRVVARAVELQTGGSLPAPDFIAGDFNIPLGSNSLSVFAPGFTPASGTAGLGRLASWPRPRQVLQIDHILVAPSWRVSDYQLLDPGASEHMAQTALLWPADTSPASGAPK